ncbi:MAG: DUF3017 domain-containing protein [Actinomycetaceae bacterium]|nr:DUF3017 domain-containing protein [Arcanobacterium sp.]MDD7686716.1 DUF3017 domain-containing protein [Actinomycetaceae bacterium]MDY5272606.1 DUF3017 domain-containing protein [Arcanobacterium sp.]
MKDLPSPWFYMVLLVWLAAILAVALCIHPTAAAYMLSASLAVAAVLRATCSPRVIPHVRARWFDVCCLLGLALALLYLAPWGLSPAL